MFYLLLPEDYISFCRIMVNEKRGDVMMRKSTAITTFIQEIAYLLDKGVSFSIAEVNHHIENKDVIDWLEQQFPVDSDISLDFSLFKQPHREYIHNELESYWGGYAGKEKRKWGIENNGLCIMLCWSVEVVRNLYDDRSNTPEEEWIEA